MESWAEELGNCRLCAWECGADRLRKGGICRIKLPEIAYTSVSKATKSVAVTFLGCCFRCIYCNAYRLSQYPVVGWYYRGVVPPEDLARELLDCLGSSKSKEVGADAVNFTGGEPVINLPYMEKVVSIMRRRFDGLRVGIATNGFASDKPFERMIDLCSWMSFEIKAYDDETHRAITGAPVDPVLRNAEHIISKARSKIRVIRTVVIPDINVSDVEKIAEFLASLDPTVPYRLVGFRPNFLLYYHPGPTESMMGRLVKKAKAKGLQNVSWSGYYPYGISPLIRDIANGMSQYRTHSARIAHAYSALAGCVYAQRNCGKCPQSNSCPSMLMEPWGLQDKLRKAEKE